MAFRFTYICLILLCFSHEGQAGVGEVCLTPFYRSRDFLAKRWPALNWTRAPQILDPEWQSDKRAVQAFVHFMRQESQNPDWLQALPRTPSSLALKSVDLVFERLRRRELQAHGFFAVAKLLLKYKQLPGGFVIQDSEVQDLIRLIHAHAWRHYLSLEQAKELMVLSLNRMDAPFAGGEQSAPWFMLLDWGREKHAISDVHESLDPRRSSQKTFYWHFTKISQGYEWPKDSELGTISLSQNPSEEVAKALNSTFAGGSLMAGGEFVALIRSIVLDVNFYNHRHYIILGSVPLMVHDRFKEFACQLRIHSEQVLLTKFEAQQVNKLMATYALGLVQAAKFAGENPSLAGVTFHHRALRLKDQEFDQFSQFLKPHLNSPFAPELPVYLQRALEDVFSMAWGRNSSSDLNSEDCLRKSFAGMFPDNEDTLL